MESIKKEEFAFLFWLMRWMKEVELLTAAPIKEKKTFLLINA